MLIYKFGGSSVKDANYIRSLLPLIQAQNSEKMVLVVSAMGKMTNAFEKLLKLYRSNDSDREKHLEIIKKYHFDIITELFNKDNAIFNTINNCFEKLNVKLKQIDGQDYDFSYDQTVSFGELLSSNILSAFLNQEGIDNKWVDASNFLITNDKYRDARIDWNKTKEQIETKLKPEFLNTNLIVTQGFIGGTIKGFRTTIGREGSDFSAAIFAHCLDAQHLTVWKDVPGILNANPNQFQNARNLEHISYHEAVELAFYGASVIHPRTLQPLKSKQIPLHIRSFINPDLSSLIDNSSHTDGAIPSFIIKENQILFTISSRDFTFIDASKLTGILKLFSTYLFHIRLIQNSALNFSIVADENPIQFEEFLSKLQIDYKVKYNRNLSLLTIRHLPNESVSKLFNDTDVFLEMHSRMTQQYVLSSDSLLDKLDELAAYV